MFIQEVERFNANDDLYKLSNILFEDSVWVNEGDLIAEFETSKSSVEVFAVASGYFRALALVGDFLKPGAAFVAFYSSIAELEENLDSKIFPKDSLEFEPGGVEEELVDASIELQLTERARKYIEDNKFDITELKSSKKYYRYKDVLSHYSPLRFLQKNSLILLGGAGTSNMLLDLIRRSSNVAVAGILDSNLDIGSNVNGVPVLGGDELLPDLYDLNLRNVVLSFTSLDNLESRRERYHSLKADGFNFPNLIDPTALLEPSVELGEGNIFLSRSYLGSNSKVGNINFFNTGSLVSHDHLALENNHYAPASVLAGKVSVGSNNLFGMSTTIYMNLKIGSSNIIANGVNLFNDLGDNARVLN